MAKNLTYNDIPAALQEILDKLSHEPSTDTNAQGINQRLSLLEKKVDYLLLLASPDKPVMDMQSVCRLLKLKPKAVYGLASEGALPSRSQGKKTVFYEDGVYKYYAKQVSSKMAESSPESSAKPSAPITVEPDGRQRIDINGACIMLGRTKGAIYQQVSTKNIPFHKDGRDLYFYTDELRKWLLRHPPLKRKPKVTPPENELE